MATTLKFMSTMTVEKFKADMASDKLDVLENEKTGKLFFSCGGKTGAVSLKGVPEKSPMISLVQGDEGEEFFLLHEEGTGGATVVATF